MTDKEVGEMWRGVIEADRHGREWAHPVLHCVNQKRELIRKLAEERAWKIAVTYYKVHGPDEDAVKSSIKAALRDFGIDPETWVKP